MRSRSAVVTPGLSAARISSCISATTRPARRITAICAVLRTAGLRENSTDPAPALRLRLPGAPVDDGVQPLADLVRRAKAVNGLEQAAALVEREQRGRLLGVEGEPLLDRLLGVVVTLDDLATATV